MKNWVSDYDTFKTTLGFQAHVDGFRIKASFQNSVRHAERGAIDVKLLSEEELLGLLPLSTLDS